MEQTKRPPFSVFTRHPAYYDPEDFTDEPIDHGNEETPVSDNEKEIEPLKDALYLNHPTNKENE